MNFKLFQFLKIKSIENQLKLCIKEEININKYFKTINSHFMLS
jgi:hypothetical protein